MNHNEYEITVKEGVQKLCLNHNMGAIISILLFFLFNTFITQY